MSASNVIDNLSCCTAGKRALGCACENCTCSSFASENAALKAELQALRSQLASVSGSDISVSSTPNAASITSSTLSNGQEVHIAPEELASMRSIFALFDTDGDGKISRSDLSALHQKLGEPITEDEAAGAVAMIGKGKGDITFEEFVAYWDGTHPSIEETADAPFQKDIRERARKWYQAKFKFVKARIATPAVGRVFTQAVGECPSLEYRINFYYSGPNGPVQISPWHEIPYKNDDGTYNMIVEIPKWTRRKFEIATGEPFNPIKQDTKNGKLREYGWGDMLFNYGAMPQTWEDPAHVSPDTKAAGDNDPLDLVELGSKMWAAGSIVRVKILGVLGLIDSGETDWKVIALSAEDPLAKDINDIHDLNIHMPGAVDALTNWLRLYKTPTVNEFAFDGNARSRRYALEIVEETHQHWKDLVKRSSCESISSSGLTRSESCSQLTTQFE